MDIEAGLRATVEWYRRRHEGEDMRAVTVSQLRDLEAASV
jgi:hypothetical protein